MADPTYNRSNTLDGPAWSAAAVTPDDDADLDRIATSAVWVGTTGNMSVVMSGGGSVTFNAIPAGTELRIRVDRINATNTTASNIVALYVD